MRPISEADLSLKIVGCVGSSRLQLQLIIWTLIRGFPSMFTNNVTIISLHIVIANNLCSFLIIWLKNLFKDWVNLNPLKIQLVKNFLSQSWWFSFCGRSKVFGTSYTQENAHWLKIKMCASLVFQVYIIDVTDGQHRWTVKHRYSDFYDLHEKVSDQNHEAALCCYIQLFSLSFRNAHCNIMGIVYQTFEEGTSWFLLLTSKISFGGWRVGVAVSSVRRSWSRSSLDFCPRDFSCSN